MIDLDETLGEVYAAMNTRYGQACAWDAWRQPHDCSGGDAARVVVLVGGDPLPIPMFCPLCGQNINAPWQATVDVTGVATSMEKRA